jgi:glycosyltransferase involved in cell wall biosynthesis
MRTLIDVIIPVFNREATIKRAIESVLAQSYQHFNLYVVNDGSTDATENLMTPFLINKNVHLLRQENKGVSAARNLGIRTGTAEWIAFLDSDDEWLPEKLSLQVHFLNHNRNIRFVHSNEIWIRNGVRVNPKQKFDKSNQEIFKRSLETCLISPSTVILRRELLNQHNLFDESFEICEDYDLWLKILATDEIGFVPDFLVKKYGGHEDQLSLRYPAMDFWRIRSLINLLDQGLLTEVQEREVRAEITKKALILTKGLIKHGQMDQYQKLLEMLDRIKPKKS